MRLLMQTHRDTTAALQTHMQNVVSEAIEQVLDTEQNGKKRLLVEVDICPTADTRSPLLFCKYDNAPNNKELRDKLVNAALDAYHKLHNKKYELYAVAVEGTYHRLANKSSGSLAA